MKSFILLVSITSSLGLPQEFRGRNSEDLLALESQNNAVDISEKSGKYCLTAGCVKAAALILENVDFEKDPCEDFYDFACGKLEKESVIPDHKSSIGAFSSVRDKLNERLKKLFESKPTKDEPPIFNSVRKFYSSCMDLDHIESNSKGELRDILTELGGWPVLGDKVDPDFTWYKLMAKADSLGFGTGKVVSVGISTDADQSTKRIMEIDQASLGLDREYLTKGFDDKDVQAYYKYMQDAAVYMGATQDNAKKQMKEALDFELELANITMKREERRNKTALNNKMKLGEVKQFYDLDWVAISNSMLSNPTGDNALTADEIVNVATPRFLKDVAKLIKKTDPKVLANFMIWRFVKGSFSYMDQEARDITLEYSKVLAGTKQEAPRWEKCVKATSGNSGNYLYWYEGSLTNAVGSMYARKYFPLSNKKIADEMVKFIRKEFKLMLDELDWMDESTKTKAHAKADSMTPFIAYAEEILDNDLLNEYYDGLEVNDASYLKNYLKLKQHINEYYVKEFRKPIDKKSWKTHGGAAVVNAFYSSDENSIQFPAGILDGLFFQADRPSYMNYGSIGMVVGHEITHGFDDQGSQRDGEGNLNNWWQPFAKKNYLKKTGCIIDQYGNYTVDIEGEILNLNGINTQGENIADNGGYKEAIRAYERLTQQYGEEPKLPGLPYTPRQMFWLSGASIWCGAMRPATLKNRVLTDPHSPGRFRVNGSFKNMKEFSKDWNCPLGSPMNPVKKCSVW